jgi:sugar phosphate permease
MHRPTTATKQTGFLDSAQPGQPEKLLDTGPRESSSQHFINVGLCALATLFVLATPSVLLPMMYSEIARDTGWSFTQITAFSALKFFSGAIASLVVSAIVMRISAKSILLAGVTASGAALFCLGAELTPELFQALGFTMGAASIATSLSCKVLLGYWFKANLGKAVGTAFLGGSIGGICIPILGLWLVDLLGWQLTGALFGAILLIGVAPLIYFFLRERPDASVNAQQKASIAKTTLSFSAMQKTLLTDRRVMALLLAQLLVGAVDYALLAHTPLFLELDGGLDRATIGIGMSLLMVASIPGKLGFGWLYDKYAIPGVAFCWGLGALASLLALQSGGTAMLLAFCVLRGIVHGGVLISAPSIALHTVGTERGVQLICMLSFANLMGAAIGTWGLARVQLATGAYDAGLWAVCLAGVAASMIACFCSQRAAS